MGDPPAVVVAVAPLPEQGLDLLHAVFSGGVQLEQRPNHGRLLLVDDQPPAVLDVAEDAAVAQHHVFLDGLGVAEFDAAGELAQLVLGDAGHDGQAELAVLVEGIDVVVLKEHPHPGAEQLPCVEDGVQGVAGEAGDLLSNNEVKEPRPAVLHHAVEVLPLFCRGGGQSLVNVAGHIFPGGAFADELLVVGYLVAQGVELFIALGGHSCVEGHTKGNVVDGLGAQGLPDAVDVHGGSPLRFVLSSSNLQFITQRRIKQGGREIFAVPFAVIPTAAAQHSLKQYLLVTPVRPASPPRPRRGCP